MITPYPYRSTGVYDKTMFSAIGGHGFYTLKLLEKKTRVVILAEQISDEPDIAVNRRNTILRIWKRGSLFGMYRLLQIATRLDRIRVVLIQFEFSTYGGIISNILLLVLTALMSVSGKTVFIEAHQVVKDLSSLRKHTNITHPLAIWSYNYGLMLYYKLLSTVSTTIIVFETGLKDRLATLISMEKIMVSKLPPACAERSKYKKSAKVNRVALGYKKSDIILLVFGYINAYKGIDWITQQMSRNHSKYKLVLAGGPNPYHKHKSYYRKFYRATVSAAMYNSQVYHTGFVPEEEVQDWFQFSDLVVMPYTSFISASGVFSLAIQQERPVLLSYTLMAYALADDFQEAMAYAGLEIKELFFELNEYSFSRLLERFSVDMQYRSQLFSFSIALNSKRSGDSTLENLWNILDGQSNHFSTEANKP